MRRIRPATPETLAAVQDLYDRSILAADWLPGEARYESDFSKASAGETVSVCADEAGRILGFISVWPAGAFIHHLYVDAGHQGLGIGHELVGSLASWLPLPWRLKCVLANAKAMNFYSGLGFETVSVHPLENPPYALLSKRDA